MTTYQAVIIGGGPAGHTAAVRIAQLGGKVALVERDFIGSICTNWGCTPSKSMIESAKVAKTIADGAYYGVDVATYAVNFGRVAERRDQVIQQTRASITDLLQHHCVDIFQGEGRILSPNEVAVKGGKLDPDGETMKYDGESRMLTTENIIIATGSQPMIPGFIDSNDPGIVSSNRLISIKELPETLTIIGGGVIGLEFATIFSNLGTKVTIIEFLDRVLAQMDEEISSTITDLMEENGVTVLTAYKCLAIADGMVTAENMHTGETITIPSPMTLVAIGRKAVINQQMFDTAGLEYTPKGVGVDAHMRTNVKGIWAVGDATGRSILAHVGIQQGVVAAENIMRKDGQNLRKMDYAIIPAVIYSIPEIVGVGTVPENLEGIQFSRVPFSKNLRAGIENYPEGFLKVWIRENHVIAAQALGHHVYEIMQELANMIAMETPIAAVSEIIHAHPTYAEIIRSALESAQGKAVDFYL